jgi:hypothetical protein
MIAKKPQLSPQCRQFFRAGPEVDEAAASPAGRPMSIKPATAHKTKAPAKTSAAKTSATKTKAKPKKTAKPAAT